MRSKALTLKIPHRYFDEIKKFAVECGFKNARQMFTWLPIYCRAARRAPRFAVALANVSEEIQDLAIDHVCNDRDVTVVCPHCGERIEIGAFVLDPFLADAKLCRELDAMVAGTAGDPAGRPPNALKG